MPRFPSFSVWLALFAAVASACVPAVDLSQLHPSDGGEVELDEVDGDVQIVDEGSGPDDTSDDDVDAADDISTPDADADADADVEDLGTDADAGDGHDGATDADAGPCPEGWSDLSTNLCWENPPSGIFGSWDTASGHCVSLSGASGLPWRLPTISELRTLIRGCPSTATSGTCGVSDTCSSVSACGSLPSCQWCDDMSGPSPGGCYWPDEFGSACHWYWSSIPDPDRPDWTWGVGFNNAAIYDTPRTCSPGACYVRCVRPGP